MSQSLRSLSDQQVLDNTDSIVVQDRKLTLRLLEHLHEIERRQLHLKRGFGSMFDYCTHHLRLSEPAASRRIRTARVLARYPRLHDFLESGDINLTTASMVAKILNPGNADLILERIKGKSKREVEDILAELAPQTLLPPDRVHPLVVPVTSDARIAPVTVAGDREKSPNTAETPQPAEKETPQFKRMARVEFTAHEELMVKLDRIRSLASHRLSMNASFEELIDFMSEYFLRREDPEARHLRRELRGSTQESMANMPASNSAPRVPSNSARHIPAQVRDEVLVRDKRCTYVGPDGQRCQSTAVLQVDHINPVAMGGAGEVDNLRVLCGPHNRLESERLMGQRRKSTVT